MFRHYSHGHSLLVGIAFGLLLERNLLLVGVACFAAGALTAVVLPRLYVGVRATLEAFAVYLAGRRVRERRRLAALRRRDGIPY